MPVYKCAVCGKVHRGEEECGGKIVRSKTLFGHLGIAQDPPALPEELPTEDHDIAIKAGKTLDRVARVVMPMLSRYGCDRFRWEHAGYSVDIRPNAEHHARPERT